VRVRAFAKINLSLRVLGARGDGYHELRTIFQSIALHDTLTIREGRGPLRLTCSDLECPADNTNLVWRAAERLWSAAGRRGAPRDVAVALEKRIPMEAGLGGGSSDAAAALRALSRLWRVDAQKARAVAVELGADVPFFFEGGTVLGLERGDLLFPLLDYPPAWVVVVLPGFGVSTREAFGWWDADQRAGGAGAAAGAGKSDLINDLEGPVAAHHSSIGRTVSALKKAGATHAAMSGSGSAVFGLFPTRAAAQRVAAALATRTRRALVTHTLNRAKYQALAAA
jgi:4-diphosphocytidyl-2-C-methyl-D-erythritol kinase